MELAVLILQDVWPPTPSENYRKSHFIAEEWVDKVSPLGFRSLA